jgi:hypothetical protein
MFGLEKKTKERFEFALEEEIKSDPGKKKALLEEADSWEQEIKSVLRTGTDVEHFDDFGILLHGITALKKVLNKISAHK